MIKNKINWIWTTLLIPSLSWGLQTITTNNHARSSLELSQEGFNRVFIEGDRIQAVKGNVNQYRLQSDEQLGEIYIKPLVEEPFHVFVSTEKRKTLQLVFQPSDIEPSTIQIIIQEPEKLNVKKAESPKNTWIEIIDAIREGKIPNNSRVSNVTKSQYKPLQIGLQAKIIQLVESSSWQVETYRLKNSSKNLIKAKPRDFYTNNTMAVFLSHNTIHPQQEVTLYKVVKHD